jgi:hypothetical protein
MPRSVLPLSLAASIAVLGACQPTHPLDVYVSARNAIAARNWTRANERVDELMRIDPQPGDHFLRAEIHAGQGQVEPAISELELAISQGAADPGSADWAEALREEPIWKPLRGDSRFEALAARAESARWKPDPLKFDTQTSGKPLHGRFSPPNNLYLTRLRRTHDLDTLVSTTKTDLDRVKRVCHWVHARCMKEGSSRGLPQDPIALLEAADAGRRLRSVELSTVTAGCLNAVGIPARAVGAQSRDVETRRLGAGHVFVEAWLEDRQAWVFVDPELDVIGVAKDGTPMDAVAFRQSLALKDPPIEYPASLAMCMYHFTTSIDQRYPIDSRSVGEAMLAPVGADAPRAFQREPVGPPAYFTHNSADFHAAPRITR